MMNITAEKSRALCLHKKHGIGTCFYDYDMKREVRQVYNVLVCDDDKEIVEAIDIYLSQEGCNAGIFGGGNPPAFDGRDDAQAGRNPGHAQDS